MIIFFLNSGFGIENVSATPTFFFKGTPREESKSFLESNLCLRSLIFPVAKLKTSLLNPSQSFFRI